MAHAMHDDNTLGKKMPGISAHRLLWTAGERAR